MSRCSMVNSFTIERSKCWRYRPSTAGVSADCPPPSAFEPCQRSSVSLLSRLTSHRQTGLSRPACASATADLREFQRSFDASRPAVGLRRWCSTSVLVNAMRRGPMRRRWRPRRQPTRHVSSSPSGRRQPRIRPGRRSRKEMAGAPTYSIAGPKFCRRFGCRCR